MPAVKSKMCCQFACRSKSPLFANATTVDLCPWPLRFLPVDRRGHLEIALTGTPTLMRFGQQCPNEPESQRLVRNYPAHPLTPTPLLMASFDPIRRAQPLAIGLGEHQERQSIFYTDSVPSDSLLPTTQTKQLTMTRLVHPGHDQGTRQTHRLITANFDHQGIDPDETVGRLTQGMLIQALTRASRAGHNGLTVEPEKRVPQNSSGPLATLPLDTKCPTYAFCSKNSYRWLNSTQLRNGEKFEAESCTHPEVLKNSAVSIGLILHRTLFFY